MTFSDVLTAIGVSVVFSVLGLIVTHYLEARCHAWMQRDRMRG